MNKPPGNRKFSRSEKGIITCIPLTFALEKNQSFGYGQLLTDTWLKAKADLRYYNQTAKFVVFFVEDSVKMPGISVRSGLYIGPKRLQLNCSPNSLFLV